MSKLMRIHEHASKIITGLDYTLLVVEQWKESPPGFEELCERVRRSAGFAKADCTRIVQICEIKFEENRRWGYIDNDDRAAVQEIHDCTKRALPQIDHFQHEVAFLAEQSQVDILESRQSVAVAFEEHVLRRAKRMRNLAKRMLVTADIIQTSVLLALDRYRILSILTILRPPMMMAFLDFEPASPSKSALTTACGLLLDDCCHGADVYCF